MVSGGEESGGLLSFMSVRLIVGEEHHMPCSITWLDDRYDARVNDLISFPPMAVSGQRGGGTSLTNALQSRVILAFDILAR
jgi:hypothetical protein